MELLTPKEVYDCIRHGAADGGWQGFATHIQNALIAKNRPTQNADTIFKQYEHLINRKFIDVNTGKVYTYLGVLIADDDYYYCLYSKENGLQLLSCVGDIENFGFDLKDEDAQEL